MGRERQRASERPSPSLQNLIECTAGDEAARTKKKSAGRIANAPRGFSQGALRDPLSESKIQNPFALKGLVQTQGV